MSKFKLKLVAKGRPDKRISLKHAKSLLKYKMNTKPEYSLFDKFVDVIPDRWTVRYPGNDVFWALYRKLE